MPRLLLTAVLLALSPVALAQMSQAVGPQVCGDLQNAYGPWDYTNTEHFREKLPIVTINHFTPEVEALLRGKSSYLGGDIDYTLRAFPNHHRALMAMVNLGQKEKTNRPRGANYTVECYLERALRFKPDDGVVMMIYGVYQHRQGRIDDALKSLVEASRRTPDNANITYNLGLVYFDKRDYTAALEAAHKARELGFPLRGLEQKLRKAGKWDG